MSKASKIISIILVYAIIITVVVASVHKVYSNHRDDLLRVVNQKIAEAGEKCILDGKCVESKITLDFLINNNYIDNQVHPITKEYVSLETQVLCENYKCVSNVE